MSQKYRLVTRSDMDGLACGVLLRELDLIGDIKFVHPKDVQDGKIEITAQDITTNLPYAPQAHLAFDHHYSETLRVEAKNPNHIIDPDAPSAARVVYNYFGGAEKFPANLKEMLAAVDKADSAQFTREDILAPQGWELLSFLMDARTGLGRFKNFGISNYSLMMDLISYCKNHTIEEILALPDVGERVDLYMAHQNDFSAQIHRCLTLHGNVGVLDLRAEETIFAGNRFMVYALYPEINVSIHVIWGLKKQNTSLAVGKSILNRTSAANIGELLLTYGGGGHIAAGTCQIPNDQADTILRELVARLKD